jgi:hypothetical protein
MYGSLIGLIETAANNSNNWDINTLLIVLQNRGQLPSVSQGRTIVPPNFPQDANALQGS